MKKIKCILLVDDSKSTNFYNKKMIQLSGIADQVYEVNNGLEALEYLEKRGRFSEGDFPRPNVIFLDINMPKMDGFEFLENYVNLESDKKTDVLITFLTTSNWDKDKIRAYQNQAVVHDFIEKPLEKATLNSIYDYYINNKDFSESVI